MTTQGEIKRLQQRANAEAFISRQNRQAVNPIQEQLSEQRASLKETMQRHSKRMSALKKTPEGVRKFVKSEVSRLAAAGVVPEVQDAAPPEPVGKSLARKRKAK